ncbi:MAG: anti-sigma factor family protein [Elusimicrobiales bacterium]
MDHNKCKENLSAYLDGELPAVERSLVEAHLADCPDCRAVLGQLNAVSGLVKKHVMEPVPASLEKKVLRGAAPARPWLKPVLAFATAAAVVMVVLNLNRAPENSYSPDLGFGSRVEVEPLAATAEPADVAALSAEAAAPAAPAAAPAADYSGAAAEADKKSERPAAVTAVRGSLGQAKFAARSAGPAGAGGFASGYKPGAAPSETPGEFSGPVCVHVSDPGVLREAERATLDALAFLRTTCPKTVQAAPGAAFVKKDGSRKTVPARACSYGFILFDGERDPLVITDPRAVPAEYRKYFGLPR